MELIYNGLTSCKLLRVWRSFIKPVLGPPFTIIVYRMVATSIEHQAITTRPSASTFGVFRRKSRTYNRAVTARVARKNRIQSVIYILLVQNLRHTARSPNDSLGQKKYEVTYNYGN